MADCWKVLPNFELKSEAEEVGPSLPRMRCCLKCPSLGQPCPLLPESQGDGGYLKLYPGETLLFSETLSSRVKEYLGMHWSQALSRSHTQPILMPRTPPWMEKGGRCEPSHSPRLPVRGWSGVGPGAGGACHDKWTSDFFSFSRWRTEVRRKKSGLSHVA